MPSFAVVSTGDEIVDVGRRVAAHQIRPSNAYGMAAALRGLGCEAETPIVGDNRGKILQVLEKALRTRDGLIISGGVSMGKADFVPDVLRALRVKPKFHGVSQRPGRPFWFGLSPAGKPVFALPGNPVSSLVCFRRFVLPLLRDDPPEFAALAAKVVFDKPLTFFLPVRVASGRDGKLQATPLRYGGSGDLNAVGESDGFLELAKDRDVFPVGFVARFWRWVN
jgi:molybdopterin molybdotransferase